MANMMDYLHWRGDLSLDSDPFNDVDNLLLSQIVYMDFEGQVPENPGEEIPLKRAVDAYFEKMLGKDLHLGAVISPLIFDMAKKMATAPRFEWMGMTAYRNEIKESSDGQSQWMALTLLLEDGTLYIAFGGTDDTIVSWKEDFDMAVCETIPAQRQAADYARRVMLAYPDRRVRLGGHSKGGNLAIYAAAKCGGDLQDRIVTVYANDAPGFSKSFLADPEYLAVKNRVRLFIPDRSFVGLLFYHDARRVIVKCSEKSIRQHDCFSWLVERNYPEQAPAIAGEALLLRKAVEAWMNGMTVEERKAFLEAFYKALTGFEAKTLTDLMEDRAILLRSYRKLDAEQRRVIRDTLKRLLSSGREVYASVLAKPAVAPKEEAQIPKAAKTRSKSKTKTGFVTHLDGASIGVKSGKKRRTSERS
jgi:hypothetical protein